MNTDRPPNDGASQAKIGPYAVLRKVGSGGAGEVYACRDDALGRVVAVKILHRGAAGDNTRRDRFVREGRMMAKISSPHVVSIFGFGEMGARPYLVMEFLEGEDLETRLLRTKRPLRPPEAITYARDAARGLQAASKLDIVHRDVKPANIIVVDGQAKLTDFGLARPQDGSAMVTTEGLVTGTPAFLAPERARAIGDDQRSDIYSLGATLFCLLTGRPPYIKETPIDVITAHLREPVPRVRDYSKRVSPALDDLVARMMAKSPEDRFATYTELLRAMEPVLALEVVGNHSGPSTAAPAAEMPEASGMVGIPTGVMGSLKRMGLIEIIQMLELGKKTARLEIIPADDRPRGILGIKDGQLIFCQYGRRFAEKAFYHLSRVVEGGFQIHYGHEPADMNISKPTAFLILEAVRRQDEISRGITPADEEGDDAFDDMPHTSPEEESRHVDLRPAPANIPHLSQELELPASLLDEPTLNGSDDDHDDQRIGTESISDADLVDVDPTLHSAPNLAGGGGPTVPSVVDLDATDAHPQPFVDRTMAAPIPEFGTSESASAADVADVTHEQPAPVPAVRPAAPVVEPAAARPPMAKETPRELSAPMMARREPKWEERTDEVARDKTAAFEMVPDAYDDDAAFDRADTLITDLPTLSPRRKGQIGARSALSPEGPISALPRAAVSGTVRVFDLARHSPTMRQLFTKHHWLRRIDDAMRDLMAPLLRALDVRPWLLWAFAAGFLLMFILLSALVSGGARPSTLKRIKAGEAAAVLAELDDIRASERSAREDLYRGHALAALEREDEAMDAYARALKKGRVDARALGVVVERLDKEQAIKEKSLLVAWPKKTKSKKRLLEKIKYGTYNERLHARAILVERNDDDGIDMEAFHIKNLAEAPRCEDRKVALSALRERKEASDGMAEAVKTAQKRKGNHCMDAAFREMLPQLYQK